MPLRLSIMAVSQEFLMKVRLNLPLSLLKTLPTTMNPQIWPTVPLLMRFI